MYYNYLDIPVQNQNVLRMDKRVGEATEKYILQCPPQKPANSFMLVLD